MTIHDDTIAENFGFAGSTIGTYGQLALDDMAVSDLAVSIRRFLPALTDTFNTVDAITSLAGVIVEQVLHCTENYVSATHYHLAVSEGASLTEAILRALPMTISEGVGVAASAVAQAALRIIEALSIAEAVAPAAVYHLSLSDQVALIAAVARFLGAEAADLIDIADVAVGPAYKAGILSETIGIVGSLQPLFLLRVVANDRVQISDADLVNTIFNGMLADGVEILAGFLLPGTSFTTWAMNTRTAAVTEYRNYDFNSFARVGNKYLGASESGLYELLGDDDDGTDIVATIRSGFAQWAGAHLHGFKAAYLAVRGEGQFVLRLITGDGNTFNYTVSMDDMRTTKMNMGKGLRARYFAFELVSAGQDFDLESLEFVPLAAQRRV